MKSAKAKKKSAVANAETLRRVFTLPENRDSRLYQIEDYISNNLHGFLKEHIVASDDALVKIEKDFMTTEIPEDPNFVSDHADFVLNKVVAQSVHTASPTFVGHMTSAIPYFMLPLGKIMIALNQNLVKIETSKAFTPLERQVVAMLHRAAFDESDAFYKKHIHSPDHALGLFCSGGTIANVTALWVARNKFFAGRIPGFNLADSGLASGYEKAKIKRLVFLVSELGHYSFAKAADILGLGRENIIRIETDGNYKISIKKLNAQIKVLQKDDCGIMALVGVAGTTETGHVDPLNELADIAKQHKLFFHVDAAWGGPTIFSKTYRHLLSGIERANSITFDPHKQLYVPMGNGIVIFRDPNDINAVRYHAQYIIREGSKDLGKFTLEGSRPGTALLVHAALHIIGRKGYELLIDMGIEKARKFSEMIKKDPDFEIITEPELNLLTYRYAPKKVRETHKKSLEQMNKNFNKLNIQLQKVQREQGKSFVSRTVIKPAKYDRQPVNVLRVVLANPLTDLKILKDILEEQRIIGKNLLPKYF